MPRKKQPRNVAKARALRKTMTLPEVLLWNLLRRNPEGIHFRRQHEIGDYVLDFYCASARLCIEVDGIAHDIGDRPVRDTVRDHWLEQQGIEVARIVAVDVLKSPEDVAAMLVLHCKG